MKRIYILLLVCVCAIGINSCSKTSDPASTNNTNGNNNTALGTMTLTVDGTTMTFPTAIAVSSNAGGYSTVTVSSADSTGRGCGFTLTNISGVGTYDVATSYTGGALKSVVMVYSYKDGSGNSVSFASPSTGSSVGKITISEYAATNIKATFNGTLSGTSGSGSVTITNGSVNAKF